MQNIRRDIEQLKRHVFGDPESPEDRPGLVLDVARIDTLVDRIEENQLKTNVLLGELNTSVKTLSTKADLFPNAVREFARLAALVIVGLLVAGGTTLLNWVWG